MLAAALLADRIVIGPTPGKGLGAFAASPIRKGTLVCSYEGTVRTRAEVSSRGNDYLFELSDGLYVDGAQSSHVSRYINHDELGMLLRTQSLRCHSIYR
jgi:SET domain-containing protein